MEGRPHSDDGDGRFLPAVFEEDVFSDVGRGGEWDTEDEYPDCTTAMDPTPWPVSGEGADAAKAGAVS